MAPQVFPWEVLERIIGHSGDHLQTLYNFSLTCRALRSRALCLLVADVHFQRRVKIFDFCDFLKAGPHLKPLVRSVTVHPDDFAPFPLLDILPNLSDLTFARGPLDSGETTGVLNRSHTLICCKCLGARIQTLHLHGLFFPTYLEFARLLLAFANLRGLICRDLVIKAEGNRAPLDAIKQRLSRQLRLLVVDVDEHTNNEEFYDEPSVARLLVDSELVQSSVETLTMRPFRSHGFLHPFRWPQLQKLVLKVQFSAESIAGTTVFLKGFHVPGPRPTLKDVTVELQCRDLRDISKMLSGKDSDSESVPKQFAELEDILLRFPRPQISCVIDVLRDGRHPFWARELGTHFSVLSRRGGFTVTSRKVRSGAGHDGEVRDLAPSPDGKWVATASDDSTIVLWDTTDGARAQQWVSHRYSPVEFIAFSPDGQHLLSGGWDSNLVIRDLASGSHKVITPEASEGHSGIVTRCAWSSSGHMIAAALDDHIIQLWDAHTFRPINHFLKHMKDAGTQLVAFSADARWLVCGSPECVYHVWDVASGGTLHQLFWSLSGGTVAAAFDPANSTRLAIAAHRGVVKLVDVETGGELAILRSRGDTTSIAFSPDGTLIVTASDNGGVTIWDTHAGVTLFSLQGHEKRVSQICFSPSEKYIASASDDHSVRLWRVQDGSCIASFSEHGSRVSRVAFSADGETLWSGDGDGTVIMRRMHDIVAG